MANRKKRAFVPRIVLAGTSIAVVPAIVAAAAGCRDASPTIFALAMQTFGTADGGDGGDAGDGTLGDEFFGVALAVQAFDAADGTQGDEHVIVALAVIAFDAGKPDGH